MPHLSHSPLSSRKQSIAQNFAKAVNYNQNAFVQSKVCDLLIAQILNKQQSSVLEVGAGQGQLTKKLIQSITAKHWHINELCAEHRQALQSIVPTAQIHIGDGENLSLADKHSLIISANAVQWFDNPLSFIAKSANDLEGGGQLLFNTFTPNNFKQIRQLTGQGLVYPAVDQWQKELAVHGFETKSIDTYCYDLKFDSPKEVLKHIKQTGVSVNTVNKVRTVKTKTMNSSDLAPPNGYISDYNSDFNNEVNNELNNNYNGNFRWSKSSLQTFIKDYQNNFSNDDGKVILTYEVLLISAVKPV